MNLKHKINSLMIFLLATMVFTLLPQGSSAQMNLKKQIKDPKIEIFGTLKDTTDYFGRQRFTGMVRNREKERIDYINIEFVMRNREGKIVSTVSRFIQGKFHRFQDRTTSKSSLGPNQRGNFDIIVNIPADSIYSFTYKITGKHFIFK